MRAATLFVVEIRSRRGGRLKWGRWAMWPSPSFTRLGQARREERMLTSLDSRGWERQTRVIPYDRRPAIPGARRR